MIDKETGEVAGGCEWFIFHKNPFPDGPLPVKCTWYPEGTERAEYAERMLSQPFFHDNVGFNVHMLVSMPWVYAEVSTTWGWATSYGVGPRDN